MKIRKIWIAMVALMATEPLWAQSQIGGAVMNHDLMWAPDMAELSRVQPFGTARAMGMGGAFTSLGADLTSMSVNPAGLGMYQRNEFAVTPLVPMSKATTEGVDAWAGNSRTRFTVANFGAVANLYESSTGRLTSLSFGVGMNRVADFNNRYSFTTESRYDPATGHLMPTIADIYCRQLNEQQVTTSGNNSIVMQNWNPYVWSAILGYDGYMLDYDAAYASPTWDNPWTVERIGQNASVLHSFDVAQSGSINEFDISFGGNCNNVVYFGMTLGIQSVRKRTTVTYQEEYGYFNSQGYAQSFDPERQVWYDLEEQLDMANLYQESVLQGAGVNCKFGVIVRPTKGLRLGLAFHTPTYYSLERSYRAGIFSKVRNNETDAVKSFENHSPRAVQDGPNSWEFTSPARLLLGASYTIGRTAILSVDYERDWYNGIRAQSLPEDSYFSRDGYKQQFKQNYRGTNTLRMGVEVRPVPMLALRAGCGFTDSMLRDNAFYTDVDVNASMPVTTQSHDFSLGAGFNLSRNVSIDVAYQNHTEKLSSYQFFYALDAQSGAPSVWSGSYTTQLHRHFVAMTLGVRF